MFRLKIFLPHLVCIGLLTSIHAAKAQDPGMQDQIPESEYDALVDLYNSTGGNAWVNQTGWLDPDAANWYGVTVVGVTYDDDGNVVSPGNVQYIVLQANQLTGDIPDSLGDLSQLQYLYLDENQLTGEIPDSLGDLSQLQALGLDGNQLAGEIPDSLGELSQLQFLGLAGNQFTGSIPDSLGDLSQLQELWLQRNQLTGSIPDSLGDLSQLQDLYLAYNQLTGSIPDSLGDLSQLQDLELYDNQLTGEIPDSLGNLSQLQELWLDENQLTGEIPDSLGDLSQLQYLGLQINQLTGGIPDSLGNLSQLQTLALEANQLTGEIPDSLGDLSQLQQLGLDDNQLTGEIPDSLGDLSQLQALGLGGNQLTGEIPDSLENLSQLQELDISENQLTGDIPDSLGDLFQLQDLELGFNQLTGEVPDLSRFAQGCNVDLYRNCLDVSPGSQSLVDIALMVASGDTVDYDPQNADCSLPDLIGNVDCTCDKSPIAGALVQIGTYSTTSESDGGYDISGIPPGTYSVTVIANNYATLTTSLTVPSGIPALTNNFYLTNLMFVINPVFDPAITTNSNAPTITNSIKAAIQVYRQTIANPMCVTILFSTTTDPTLLGENDAALASISYSQYLLDLELNTNKSANDKAALASLPAGPGTGINGNTQITLTAANLEAIGETYVAATAVADSGGGYYGKILLNVSSLGGLQATAAHEIDETLGIGGWGSSLELAGSYSGQASPTTGIGSLDLFRYSGPGIRSFTMDPTATAYFSIDGGMTKLVSFNQFGNGSDFGDWGDGVGPADGLGNSPPQVQDAFGSGNPSMGANEFIALDVVGYTLTTPPFTITTANYAAHAFTFGWSALPGQAYQVQFKTDLTGNVWNNLGSLITASNMTADISDTNASDAGRFYRVVGSSSPAVPAVLTYQTPAKGIVTPYTLVTNPTLSHRFLRPRP
jgi:Leucine-rich repeat (LRR) protein